MSPALAGGSLTTAHQGSPPFPKFHLKFLYLGPNMSEDTCINLLSMNPCSQSASVYLAPAMNQARFRTRSDAIFLLVIELAPCNHPSDKQEKSMLFWKFLVLMNQSGWQLGSGKGEATVLPLTPTVQGSQPFGVERDINTKSSTSFQRGPVRLKVHQPC